MRIAAPRAGCLGRPVAERTLPCGSLCAATGGRWQPSWTARHFSSCCHPHLDTESAQLTCWQRWKRHSARTRFPTWSAGVPGQPPRHPVPPGHWLLLEDTAPFRATLEVPGPRTGNRRRGTSSPSLPATPMWPVSPRAGRGDARLLVERFAEKDQRVEAAIRFLSPNRRPCRRLTPAIQPSSC